jgi:hypothetical protein
MVNPSLASKEVHRLPKIDANTAKTCGENEAVLNERLAALQVTTLTIPMTLFDNSTSKGEINVLMVREGRSWWQSYKKRSLTIENVVLQSITCHIR